MSEQIVNGIKTIVLHNKNYVEVAERVRIVHELKKEFEVLESQPYQVAERWVWRVVVKVGGSQYIGNAEVKLNAAKNTPDGTNPFECAETSALGRALAFAGLGTVESIASYDEIARGQPFVAVIEQPQRRIVDASPSPNGNAPSAPSGRENGATTPTLEHLIITAKKRAASLGLATDKLTWEALLQEATGEALQEKALTLALIARINGHLTGIERLRKEQAKENDCG